LPFFLCTQKKKLEKMYYTNGRQKFRENVWWVVNSIKKYIMLEFLGHNCPIP
jgi:hypothetical protein